MVVALALALRDRRRHAADEERRAEERRDLEAAQARLVYFEITAMGGLMVKILNESDRPIFHVCLESVEKSDSPDFTWQVNRNVMGARAETNSIEPRGHFKIPVNLVSEDGQAPRSRIGEYTITISFLDAAGLRWTRTGMGPPTRVLDDPTDAPAA
ncbi:hypothetical protein ERC79_13200 [Rhodococcus sp. ABRD24]|nr:hypothetical protein ERC79_13200 [Rhodococcus sp. ABRD24]